MITLIKFAFKQVFQINLLSWSVDALVFFFFNGQAVLITLIKCLKGHKYLAFSQTMELKTKYKMDQW